MQIKSLRVIGLFGGRKYDLDFPASPEEKSSPSVLILHGRNGVGKTTLLRMLDGLLRLDFNVFRRVPFEYCSLEFSNGDRIEVRLKREKQLASIDVEFQKIQVQLHPDRPGALAEKGAASVESFRQAFFKFTEDINFEFFDTERLREALPDSEEVELATRQHRIYTTSQGIIRATLQNPKARVSAPRQALAARVERFIREAQVNYQSFFATSEPELFPRIIDRLTSGDQPKYDIADLRGRLGVIHHQDELTARFGLEKDRWDYAQLVGTLDGLSIRGETGRGQALTVLGSYVEQLESRSAQRALVADRLLTFERLLQGFLTDKTVVADSRAGIRIETPSGSTLDESQLSSGELQLMYLMVAALVTRRRGSIIAIDEPEMSMHIEWQRKLVPALIECASKAEPLFIFATHSPDLAASLPEAMVELK
jgi:energy-coupling factor transporter ATP-binding protein EcfA2